MSDQADERDPAAVALGRQRWVGMSVEQRRAAMAELRAKRGRRWTAEERAAFGRRMAEARAKKRAEREVGG